MSEKRYVVLQICGIVAGVFLTYPTTVHAYEVISANGYKCVKGENNEVSCHRNIESMQKPAVISCMGKDSVLMGSLYVNLEEVSAKMIEYDSKTGCVYVSYFGDKEQEVVDRSGNIHKMRKGSSFKKVRIPGCE